MVRTIIISTMMGGIGGLSIGPSTSGHSTLSQTELSLGAIQTQNAAIRLDLWKQPALESYGFFVQRESSKPPGESRTGRASSGPAGGVTDSKRDSSQPSDVTEDPSKQSIVSETEKSLGEPEVAPKKSRDPTEGGGDTPSSFGRR